jgi:hypothetical protein
VEGIGIARLEPDGFVVILERALQVASAVARNAPVVEGASIVWLEPDGLLVILEFAFRVAFGPPRNAPVVKGGGIVRLEPYGLAVEAQLLIKVGSGKPSLEPLLVSQLFFLDRRRRVGRGLLFLGGSLCRGRCRMQHRSQRQAQVFASQALHGFVKVVWRDAYSVVAPECSERAS